MGDNKHDSLTPAMSAKIIRKNVIDGLTYTSISKLTTKKQRKQELVELIGGGFGEANDYASSLLDRAAA